MENTRTYKDIQEKLDSGKAVVLTAEEIGKRVRAGEEIKFEDVDVVTTATRGIMSGTYVVLSFKVAEPNTFMRATKVWLNGVPANVGPCPNERLGVLDLIVHGTSHSKLFPRYGGGHLFRDLVEGKTIEVEVETVEGWTFNYMTTIKEVPYAKFFATRHAFKNYLAFVNPGSETVPSIFHAIDFKGNLNEATFCGCGELNPIENDPNLETIGVGTKVLMNGAVGYVSGLGTRSSPEKPNLAGYSDLHDMVPEYLGGFQTSAGPEVVSTWAVPIPVINQNVLDNIVKIDSDVKLKIVDVSGRLPICETTYADVWEDADHTITYDSDKCIKCGICAVERTCPTEAVKYDGKNAAVHDPYICFNCGLCVSTCTGKAYSARRGALRFQGCGVDKTVPVVLRQSDRSRAIKAANDLKRLILSGEFKITEPVEKIKL